MVYTAELEDEEGCQTETRGAFLIMLAALYEIQAIDEK